MLQELLICSADSFVYSKLPPVLLIYPASDPLKCQGLCSRCLGLLVGSVEEACCLSMKQFEGCWDSRGTWTCIPFSARWAFWHGQVAPDTPCAPTGMGACDFSGWAADKCSHCHFSAVGGEQSM